MSTGGGLAGLSAALELAERGYNVTIREAEPYIGGRAHSSSFEALGQTWQVEHGFHGELFSEMWKPPFQASKISRLMKTQVRGNNII